MSFKGFKSVIEEGDTVVVYLASNQLQIVQAKSQVLSKKGVPVDNVSQTQFGALKCAELIGKEYGSRLHLSKGWVYVLQPTPELWTLSLPHRTQIIYTPDVAIILTQLELTPTSVVVECGTGSGSLSHALVRTVMPHGHVHTFDFHEARVATAAKEFDEHGLGEYVTTRCRDVCVGGFGDELDGRADAVFLDLPHPWQAIPHCPRTFKETGGRICSFSPCIEQVQKSCRALRELGFQEVETVEVLQTKYNLQTRNLRSLDLACLRNEKEATDEDGGKKEAEFVKTVTALQPCSQPGHTGFLTFATWPPVWARKSCKGVDGNEPE